MGGHQVPSAGSGDDGYDEEGYDESQRAEILEATRNGPSDGIILTDLDPDLGEDDKDDESIDETGMDSEEVGETDSSGHDGRGRHGRGRRPGRTRRRHDRR